MSVSPLASIGTGRVVAMQRLRWQQIGGNELTQRPQREGARPYPVGQLRDAELDWSYPDSVDG